MVIKQPLTPKQKSLEINLNDLIYGTFAEIGAGQEVVRNFFRAGGAAGTIAKAVSAYDMAMSDSIYGKSEDKRYVSKPRLKRMLQIEFEEILDRLQKVRPEGTRFFAFADTVAAKSFRGNRPSHGWLGVRFQHEAGAKSSEVIIHIRMHDNQNITQQESVGTIGVNLIHACFNYTNDPKAFVNSLMDNLTRDIIEIDMIRVKGDAFNGVDSRILSLELVSNGITDMVMFDCDGQILQPSDILYKKNVLVLRGSFRPPTHVNIDMLESGVKKFKESLCVDLEEECRDLVVLPEISMNNLRAGGEVDTQDFLARVDLLASLGRRVMVTNYNNYHCLNTYLSSLTNKKIVFVLGIHGVEEILDEERHKKHANGLLGALGAMFSQNTSVYVYPIMKEGDSEPRTAKNFDVAESVRPLYEYLIANGHIEDIENYDKSILNIWSREVLRMIRKDQEGWEKFVPRAAAKRIKERELFKETTDVVAEFGV